MASNVKQVLGAFDNITWILKDPLWASKASPEVIVQAFKLANFVEKASEKFKTKQGFEKCCDKLLEKFFIVPNIRQSKRNTALRLYTSMQPKARLEQCLKQMILMSACSDATLDFVAVNNHLSTNLKYQMVLNQLSGCDYTKTISNMLSIFNVETSLDILIGMLAWNEQCEVTEAILKHVLEKMLDRSVLSKTFWLTLFKAVNKDNVCQVCAKYKDFLVEFCNFIMYIGGMMELKDGTWRSDTNTLCPEITFGDLQILILALLKHGEIELFVGGRLKEAESHGSSIWADI